jgi:hypothetical protein
MTRNKIVTAIAMFLILTTAVTLIDFPTANAHTPPWNIPTFAYIAVAPNPVGAGQSITVYFWLDKVIYGASIPNDIRFHDYNLTITSPDSTTKTTIYPVCSDTTSSMFIHYTPTETGNYTFTFNFPGQQYTWTGEQMTPYGTDDVSEYTGDTYLPSTASTTITVQEAPIPSPEYSSPMPTEYWTRPIYGLNTDWWSISSNWLGASTAWVYPIAPQFFAINYGMNYAVPDAVGPLTSHVMWTKQMQSGGVVGGNLYPVGGVGYFEGTAYYNRFSNPIVMDGLLFYSDPKSFTGDITGPVKCVDLRTGELIWSRSDILPLSFGMEHMVYTPNQHGVYPPLLIAASYYYGIPDNMWIAYDAWTGDWMFNVTDVPQGLITLGPSAEFLIYNVNNAGTDESPDWQLCEWNSSRLWEPLSQYIAPEASAAVGTNYDWNVSIPWMNTLTTTSVPVFAFYDNVMLCYNSTTGVLPSAGTTFHPPSDVPYTWFAVNLNASKGQVGSVLWQNTLQPPAGNITVTASGIDPTNGVFVEVYKETMQFIGYNLNTGEKLWGPTSTPGAMDYYGNDFSGDLCGYFAYGNLYYSGMGGLVYCFDELTGALKWTYGNGGSDNSTDAGYYKPTGKYPTMIVAIGNGVIYTETGEHTATDPIYRGALTRAINATDGKEIWTLSCYGSSWPAAPGVADGYLSMFNGYDNSIYTVGRGPSATSVTAPDVGLAQGQSVVIRGRVTDISAGTKQKQQAADFPQGVPCASDEVMSQWMSYVYQQQPKPTNFTGVQVTISVLDSNGNYRTIGTTTTDSAGLYSLSWLPDIPGHYKVFASFAGTKGYWPSSDETSFTVDQAVATPTPQPTQAPSMAEQYFLPAVFGIIAAIAVVGALMLLQLRKK